MVISACHQLVTQAEAGGQIDIAIRYSERLLQLDPLHEPTHRHLMRLLAQTGQRMAALAQYTTCCHMLDAELGVLPDIATTALYEEIRSGKLDSEQGQIPRPTTPAVQGLSSLTKPAQGRLPAQASRFIGREVELSQIVALLSNPDCRLLILLGLGGIGKSRLAIEAANRKAGDFAEGLCFVSLAPANSADAMLVALAQSLGLQANRGDLQQQIVAFLQPRALLLVLDNVEHLSGAAEIVAGLLHSAPGVKILVTSRERLYLCEEWLFPVAGLAVTGGAVGEAGQLFVRSAQQVSPGFTPTGQEEAIAAICRKVEGMPLAVELAASWVRVMPCEEIVRQLTHNPDILTTPMRNLPERHRSLRTLFDHSWQLLTTEEQRVLRRVSLFQGGWALAEAVEVAGATVSLLAGLVDKSLIRSDGSGRFDLHELVRQYAAGQLAASGESQWIHQRHFAGYLRVARSADRQLRGAAVAIGYAQLETEQDNLRTALQWALETENFVDAAWLGVAFAHFWSVRGHWQEVSQWLGQLLPHRHLLPTDLRLATFLTLYQLWRGQEEFHLIEQYMDEIVSLQENSSNKVLRAVVWRSIAVAEADFSIAAAAWERCLALLSEARREPAPDEAYCVYSDSAYQHAFALFRYAIRLTDMGEYQRAERLSADSLTLFRRMNNRDYIVFPLGNLGRLALFRGDIVQARLLFQEAVAIAANIGNKFGLLDWQPRLAIATLYCGDVAESRRLLAASPHLSLELSNSMYSARIYTYLAETALWKGDHGQAAHWLAQGLTHHANQRWLRTEVVDYLWVATRLATAQENYRHAAILFGLADQVSSRIRYELIGPVRQQVDAALATVRSALSPEIFAEAYALGQQHSLDEAFTTILSSTQAIHTLREG
jgi:predicted ATPase